MRKIYVGVIGSAEADPEVLALAAEVGRGIARRGAVLVCGGRSGVMEAAARGARAEGGRPPRQAALLSLPAPGFVANQNFVPSKSKQKGGSSKNRR